MSDKNTDLTKIQSSVIQLLRFPLIVLVIFVHMLPFELKKMKWSLQGYDIYNNITELISHYIGRLPVPCFFLFSGYFFFIKVSEWNASIYFSKLKKRIKTLLIPYLIWNILHILTVYLKNLIFYQFGKGWDEGYHEIRTLPLYDLLWGRPINYPLWYLRDLIVMMILTPFYYYYYKYTKIYGLMLSLMIYLLVLESNIPGLSTTAIFYFGLGSFMALSGRNMLAFSIRYSKVAIIMAVIALGMTSYYTGSHFYEYCMRIFIVFGVIVMLFLGYKLYKYEKLKNTLIALTSSVFFIYALHTIYILGWLKGGWLKTPLSTSYSGKLLGYFLIPFICIGMIFLLYRLMKRFCPKILSLMIGNR
ncbi:acyltransferase family protein [Elizabethkingia argentiflava]|uniref:Acyltransferase family protein n=1 Tax=Elizabethkingia argenteiflava TaxID=2681556 RepID=A0A845PYA1_9FLAO|nr:acyltransferase family protein [Elizabethkingia argenteiflava]NAW51338.1 acyltransferase family protein [Elizabethkingia argenteiflava]